MYVLAFERVCDLVLVEKIILSGTLSSSCERKLEIKIKIEIKKTKSNSCRIIIFHSRKLAGPVNDVLDVLAFIV